MQTTDNLINSLQTNLTPSRKMWPVGLQFTFWAIVSFAATYFTFWFFELGTYPETITESSAITFEMIALTALIVLAGTSALVLSRPERGQLAKVLPLLTLALWTAGIVWAIASGPEFTFYGSFIDYLMAPCFRKVLAMSLVPGSLLLWLVHRGVSTKLAWASMWIGVAAAGVGYFALRVECYYIEPFHILFSHVLPVLLFVGLSLFIGRKVLKW